jgi:hypothetical protein
VVLKSSCLPVAAGAPQPLKARRSLYLWASVEACPCFSAGGWTETAVADIRLARRRDESWGAPAAALERAINTMAYPADQGRGDIESKCANIQPGGGRIAQCLADHKDSPSQPCTQAIAEVGGK